MRKGRAALLLAMLIAFGLWAAPASATQVSGSLSGSSPGPNGFAADLVFTCSLSGTTCTGIVNTTIREGTCTNSVSFGGTITVTGLQLSQVGALNATVATVSPEESYVQHPDSSCTYALGSNITETNPLTGTWDGSRGSITISGLDGEGVPFHLDGTFYADSPLGTPVFPMTVTANIGTTVSSASANFQPRPQDVGTNASTYVFAIAPATVVRNAATEKDARLAMVASGAPKDSPVQCVLAQLNASGQLQAVSASSLQAYVTGTLSAQGQAVTILNGVATANIGGATFYVGYGSTSSAMINNGVNRSAVTVPAGQVCRPDRPQTGWWWNTAQGGRGYSIEVAGNHIFFASYLYDGSGRATWLVASGNTSLDGSLFTGNLEAYGQGQTLSSAYRAPTALPNPGAITLAFSDASHGTLSWPGGTLAIERFNIVPNGLTLAPGTNQPEAGWWFNPSESGRGFFLEWQGGQLFMAGYMYDDNGNPVWYLGTNTSPLTNFQSFSANWSQYGNGQTLTGAYRPAQQVNANVAPVTITFLGGENAIMTLPGGITTAIRRFRF